MYCFNEWISYNAFIKKKKNLKKKVKACVKERTCLESNRRKILETPFRFNTVTSIIKIDEFSEDLWAAYVLNRRVQHTEFVSS